jgi:protein-L-isoaspartate O-methyltransferase
VVTAAAAEGPPPALLDQLVPGGALVCPVEHKRDERLVRMRDGEVETVAAVRFVPLVEGEA